MTDDPYARVHFDYAEATLRPAPQTGDEHREISYRVLAENDRNIATDPAYRARYYQVLIECELSGTQPAAQVAAYVCMHPLICATIEKHREERAVEQATTDNEETSNA
jgi:hypothetical protein